MKSSPARPPSHALGTARLSPRQMSRSTARHVTSSGMMGATLAPSLSRASGACHQTPHVRRPTHPNRAVGLPPPRPPQVIPLRLAINRNARCRRNRPPTHPQGPWSTPDSRATLSGTLPPSSHTTGHTTGARSRCDGPTPQTATTRRVSHALGFASTCPHRCTRSRLRPHPRHTHHRAPPRSRLILPRLLRLQAPPPPLTHGRLHQARTTRRATKNKTDLVPITGTPSSFRPSPQHSGYSCPHHPDGLASTHGERVLGYPHPYGTKNLGNSLTERTQKRHDLHRHLRP